MARRTAGFEVYRGRDGWRVRERAANGQIPGQERYASKANALRAARRLASQKRAGAWVQVLPS